MDNIEEDLDEHYCDNGGHYHPECAPDGKDLEESYMERLEGEKNSEFESVLDSLANELGDDYEYPHYEDDYDCAPCEYEPKRKSIISPITLNGKLVEITFPSIELAWKFRRI